MLSMDRGHLARIAGATLQIRSGKVIVTQVSRSMRARCPRSICIVPGPAVAPMFPEVAHLNVGDRIAIAAYLSAEKD
jgi:hypothetical protein